MCVCSTKRGNKMGSPTKENCVLQRMLQTMAVAAMIVTQVISFLVIPPFTLYVILFTRYWWLIVLYITWYLTIDKDAAVTGRRRSEWVRSWLWWKYAQMYYPIKVVKSFPKELEPKRNYLFCFYPHGMLSAGSLFTMGLDATEFQQLFPHHTTYIHSMSAFYKVPFLRELALSVGGVNVTKESLEYILGKKDGGNISGIVLGGAQEAYFCTPGVHKIILKPRKGFAKLALKQGTPVVPVYTFGETEIFSQVAFEKNSILHKLRELFRKKMGFSLIIPQGRLDMLGLVPRRKPLNVVVGEPIDVEKTENPTQEQIDNLHQLFMEKLVELFESQKKNYIKDHETAHLEII